MSEFRLAPEAEAELDDIWLHIAHESGSTDIATGVVDKITERFWRLLARYPYLGRARRRFAACAVCRLRTTSSSIASKRAAWC